MTEKYNPEIPNDKYEGWEMGETENSKEIIELKKEFAEILKEPGEDRSYLKKLTKIGAAFALAGITTLTPTKSAIAPETSPEFKAVTKARSLEEVKKNEKPELYEKVLAALGEKGGVSASPQIPEKIYKTYPLETRSISEQKQLEKKIPYFSKPEIIFGEAFVKENPELTEKYMEKIGKAMKATVIIENPDGTQGSGVIVNTKKGEIILTNAHVAKNFLETWVKTIDGISRRSKVLTIDSTKDLAALDYSKAEVETENIMYKPETLQLSETSTDDLKKGEKLALIGHPYGFPWEVNTLEFSERINLKDKWTNYAEQNKYDYELIVNKPDSRFKKLALFNANKTKKYHAKGETIPGFSGGPLISLEKKGATQLLGLHSVGNYGKAMSKKIEEHQIESGEISAKEIREFIKNYEDEKPDTQIGGEY